MKITHRQLRGIIREELLQEDGGPIMTGMERSASTLRSEEESQFVNPVVWWRERGLKHGAVDFVDELIQLTNDGHSLQAAFESSITESRKHYDVDPQRDAFRHIFGSTLFQRAVGSLAAEILGEFHELKGATKSWLLGQGFDSGWLMDRENNMIGIKLAERNPEANEEQLSSFVREVVDNGEFFLEDGVTRFRDSAAETRSPAPGT